MGFCCTCISVSPSRAIGNPIGNLDVKSGSATLYEPEFRNSGRGRLGRRIAGRTFDRGGALHGAVCKLQLGNVGKPLGLEAKDDARRPLMDRWASSV